jgi:hypothetical protein
MSKKTLNHKTARKLIEEGRNRGKTDQDILNELSQIFYDKKTIALLISGTVTNNNKKQYKMYNNILIGLIGSFVLFNVFVDFCRIESFKDLWFSIPITLVFILLAGYCIFEIARYNAPVYRMCGIFTILYSFQWYYIKHYQISYNVVEIIIILFFIVAIVFFSFFLSKKMFPNYKIRI